MRKLLLLLGFTVLQFITGQKWGGHAPDWLLLCLILWLPSLSPMERPGLAWLCGLCRDLSTGGPLGTSILLFLILTVLSHLHAPRSTPHSLLPSLLLCAGQVFGLHLLEPLLLYGRAALFDGANLLESALIASAGTLLLWLPLRLVLRVDSKRHHLRNPIRA